ncbi:MAG TPA: hypothetical protein VMM93_05155 [Vicinamibacterales bacterium]|nr:hypothetical protein [Vicinamibacterales bacterium]
MSRRRKCVQPATRGSLLIACAVSGFVVGCSAEVDVPPVEAPAAPFAVPAPPHNDHENVVLQDLQSYIHRFAEPSPLDCGRQPVRPASEVGSEELQGWLACGRQAADRSQPFVTYRAYRSLDHIGATGLVGTTDGEIFQFQYDSGHFFIGRWWMGSFRVTRCPEPRVATQPLPGAVFECPG